MFNIYIHIISQFRKLIRNQNGRMIELLQYKTRVDDNDIDFIYRSTI